MAVPSKTENENYPTRLAWEFLRKSCKASSGSTAINIDMGLDQLQLKRCEGISFQQGISGMDCKKSKDQSQVLWVYDIM
jgi:hypothetical protein